MSSTAVSVITGAAGGMGIASARRLAAAGDTVLLADLDLERVEAVAADLLASGGIAHAVPCDVTDPVAVAAVAERVGSLGTLRAVVHTAGLSPTMADWQTVLTVNLVGTARLLGALDPLVVEGTVAVCIASQAGHLVGDVPAAIATALADPLAADLLDRAAAAGIDEPGGGYGFSKWAVRQMVVELAPSWGSRGARIVSLSPGIIDTPMGRQELEQQEMMPAMIDITPLGRIGTADEIASAVEFLCSPAASFITGADLLVDGGSTAQVQKMLAEMTAGD
jgi:NAD(P)-dependent dehydrogenase (short-subunit alcohol dehydrogenase family)